MDISLGARQERHLMRQRGAGARPIQGNFGFVFKAGPLQVPTQLPTQDAPKAIVETSATREETVLPASNVPSLVANEVNMDQPGLSANADKRVTAREEPSPEPEPARPKRKPQKKRKALFTKKKPPPTKRAIAKKSDSDDDELSFENTAATVAPEKTTIATENVKKRRLKDPSEVVQVEDDFIFRRRTSDKEANRQSSRSEPAQESQSTDASKTHLKRNAAAIEELQHLPIIPDSEHDHSTPKTLPEKKKKAKTVAEIVPDRRHPEGTGKEEKTKAKIPIKRKRGMEPLSPNEEAVGPAVPQLEPSPDAKPAKRGRKATQKRDTKSIPQEYSQPEADTEENMQAEEATAFVKKPTVKASRARPAAAEKITTSPPKTAEAEKEAAEDVIEKSPAPVRKTTRPRRLRKVADRTPIEAPPGEAIKDKFEEAPTSKRKPATGARRTKKEVESLPIETKQDPAQHSAAPVTEPISTALRGEDGFGKGLIHDILTMEDPKDLMIPIQPTESESRAKTAPASKARKGRKIAQTHPESPIPVQQEQLTSKTPPRDRVPLAEQDVNSSFFPQKLSFGEKNAGSSERDAFADKLPKIKRARTTKAVTRAPRKAVLQIEHIPGVEAVDQPAKQENLCRVSKTAVADPAEREHQIDATKDKAPNSPMTSKTASAPKKPTLRRKQAEKATTRTLPTTNKNEDEDTDAGLFAPMPKLATSSRLSSSTAARKGPVKTTQKYSQQRLRAIAAQDEDVDLSDVFDGIAAIAASSSKP